MAGNVKKVFDAQVGGKFGFQRLNARKVSILNLRMLKNLCAKSIKFKFEHSLKFLGSWTDQKQI